MFLDYCSVLDLFKTSFNSRWVFPGFFSHCRTMVALTPFMCYAHPNGSRSLLKYPEKLCDEPGALDTTGAKKNAK